MREFDFGPLFRSTKTMRPRRVEIVGGATPRLQVIDGTPREQAAA